MGQLYRILLTIGLVPLLTACFPQMGEEEVPTSEIEITSYQQSMIGTTPVMVFYGNCPENTSSLFFAINGSKTSQMGALSNSNQNAMTSNPGNAYGKCENGKLTATWIVNDPYEEFTFTFKTRGSVRSGGMTKFAQIDATYIPPISGVPGFAAVSGGGRSTGGGMLLQGTIGQPTVAYKLDGAPNVSATVNLQGIIAD
jgi:hypothetical protein